jgi:hypothetical protein
MPQESHSRQLQKHPTDESRVLSFGPESLWYLERLTPGSPVYNVPFLSRLRGNLDEVAFKRALDALVDRQEVLRTVFLASGGTPVRFVVKKRPVNLMCVDLSHLPASQREIEARRLAKQEAARPFNLTRDPMLRPFLFRLSNDDVMFLFVTHHIIFELGSLAIFYRDLASFYNAFAAGEPPQLPDLVLQERDFALWQRRTLQGDRLETLSKYWKEQLAGAPIVEFPLDFPRPRVHTHRGVRRVFNMSPDLISTANECFRRLCTTPYRGLLAAFNIFLHSYSGLTDISVGSPFASRCTGIENTIGFFANTLVLRTDLSGDPTFREVIRKVDRAVLRALANSDLSFDKIVEVIQPPRDPRRTPLFQISFRGRQPYASLQLNGVAADPPEFLDNGTAKFDLALELEVLSGQSCFIEYCTDLFKEQTIVQIENDFQNLLRALIVEPDTPVSQVRTMREIRERRLPGSAAGTSAKDDQA